MAICIHMVNIAINMVNMANNSLWHPKKLQVYTGWGPQDSVQLRYKWLKTMVYNRYNELAHELYKPNYNWGAPSYNIMD